MPHTWRGRRRARFAVRSKAARAACFVVGETTMFALLAICLYPISVAPILVERDNTAISASGSVAIRAAVIADVDRNGAIHIRTDGVVVDFGGQMLRGAAPDLPPERYAGYGVRITARDVTIRNLRVSGYRAGVYATGADGLVIEDCDFSDNFRQRLTSTPQAEDLSDWLYPHDNDANEWLHNYGAGIYIEESDNVTVRRCRARKGQNALCGRKVNHARIYDNDFSFLSGWGIALYRSNHNVIVRNNCDFCMRGYSHGVYSRGQDSAGILFFEQCSDNIVAYN
ncbi:MAG: right-handed parallel beta-helix repeat-containing protein, partial [Planctomycetota bacterium]